MRSSPLYQWLIENNFFLKKDDKDTKKTHVCYDGGVLSVSDDSMDTFFENYEKSISEGYDLFICECTDEIIKMFCDLDFLGPYPSIDAILKVIDSTVTHYFKDTFEIIVLESPEKTVVKNGTTFVKKGIHLIWADLYVTRKVAIDLASVFSKTLETKLGYRNEANPWSEVIDAHVYNSSLRMALSKKINKGVVQEFIYKIVKTFPNNIEDIPLRTTSIRCWNGERPINPVEELVSAKKKETVKKCDDKVFLRVEQFIRKQTIKEWDHPLKSLVKNDKHYVAKINKGMYCINLGREHNSCGIYFIFSQDGMVQRCFCKCNEVRSTGLLCKDFKSKVFKIPLDLYQLLYPDKKMAKPRKKVTRNVSMVETYPSNLLLKKGDLEEYLRMSYNTILDIEKKC